MLNKTFLMGRLTRDPELKKTNSGKSVTGYTLAVERNYGKDKEKEVDFFDIVSWEKQAEFVTNYFAKGQMMCVEGRLQRRSWTDENNQKRNTVEVVTSDVFFAGESKKNTDSTAAPMDDTPVEYPFGNGYAPPAQNGRFIQPPPIGGHGLQTPDIDFANPTNGGHPIANADVFDPYAA